MSCSYARLRSASHSSSEGHAGQNPPPEAKSLQMLRHLTSCTYVIAVLLPHGSMNLQALSASLIPWNRTSPKQVQHLRWTSWEPADRCRASSGEARAALCSISEDSAVAPEGTEAGSPRPWASEGEKSLYKKPAPRISSPRKARHRAPCRKNFSGMKADPASAGLGAGNLVTLATPSRKTSGLKLPVIQLRSKPAARDPAARPPGAKQQGQGVQETAPKAKVQICLNLSSTCSQLCQRHVCLSHSGFDCAPARKAPKWP